MIRVTLVFLSMLTAGSLFLGAQSSSDIDYNVLSENLLQAIKDGEETSQYLKILESTTLEDLQVQLSSDKKKYAFWLNIYNSYIILTLNEQPESYEDRRTFFKAPYITIGGEKVSFAKIEHGIIRKSQWDLGLGLVRKPFPGKWERKLRVNKRDYRVHFALNCGAKSCPPVTIYDPVNLDKQLDYQTKKYLKTHSTYDEANHEVSTTPLFSWFRGDFGGKRGIKKILAAQGLVPSKKVGLKFISYDWTLHIDNFVDTPFGR